MGALCFACGLIAQGGTSVPPSPPTLEETRLAMSKWLEIEQVIAKERKEWQQGKELLTSRIDLVKREAAALSEKIGEAEKVAEEANRKRQEQLAEAQRLKDQAAGLGAIVGELEVEVQKLRKVLPDPVAARIEPLISRVPTEQTTAKVSVAERFQNVLGILNEANKANREISVGFEVHELADGKPTEVRTLYLGLGQAYFVSARGEAGIGRPTPDGWKWQPAKGIASEVLLALEIVQGKHTPVFVSLPVKLQ